MNTLQRSQWGSIGNGGQDNGTVSGLVWVVGVCAVVLTAWVLGASWLGSALLGLPVGLWIIGSVLGGRWLVSRHASSRRVLVSRPRPLEQSEPIGDRRTLQPHQARPDHAEPGTQDVPATEPDAGQFSARETIGFPSLLLGGVADAAAAASRVLASGQSPGWLERIEHASGTPGLALVSPLRVGVAIDAKNVARLESARGSLAVVFIPCEVGNDASQWKRMGLDAVVEQAGPDTPLTIRLAESPRSTAAWHDWAEALPLSYASLFPARVDPSFVTLDGFDWEDDGAVDVLRTLLECAALLSRYPARLSVGDRVRGRRALALLPGSPIVSDPALDRVMGHLASVLALRTADRCAAVERAAMRVLAAYLAWTGCGLLPEDRVAAARTIGRLGPGEGETCLRACVAAFAGGHEVLGFDLMLTGHDRLANERPQPLFDPMEYLLSDIAFNRGGAETLGKLAAGLAYATALVDRPRLAYILDDLRDEVVGAQWLICDHSKRDAVLAMIDALSASRLKSAA